VLCYQTGIKIHRDGWVEAKMKKALIIFLAAAIILGLTACSQEELVSLMGKMKYNIYGINPDVRISYEAASKVESAVTTDSDGNYVIDLDQAMALIDYIDQIKESPAKSEALKESLDKVVSETDAAKVRTALIDEASKIVVDDTSDLGKTMVEVRDAYLESLEVHIPTYFDVFALSLINDLNDTIKGYGADVTDKMLAEKGLSAVDAIKVVSDIGSVDILGNLDVSQFLGDSKDVARADGNGMKAFASTVATIVELVTVNGKLDDALYCDFIFQAKILKVAYDMMVYPFRIDGGLASLLALDPEEYPTLSTELGFVVDDLGRYVVCTTFTAMDRIDNFLADSWSEFLTVFIEDNYEGLMDFGSVKIKIDGTTVGTFLDNMGNNVLEPLLGDSYNYPKGDLDEKGLSVGLGLLQLILLEGDFSDIKTEVQRFGHDFLDMLNTAAVIIIDTEFESLLTYLNKLIDKNLY